MDNVCTLGRAIGRRVFGKHVGDLSLSFFLFRFLFLFLALLRVCGGVLPERTPDGGREAVLTIANGQPWLTSSNVASGKLTWSISI